MSRICTNVAIISSADKKELLTVLTEVKNAFECYTSIEVDDNRCEFEFGSHDSFPKETFEKITLRHPDNSLYIQIITYELPSEYIAHHVYRDGNWVDKLKEKQKTNP